MRVSRERENSTVRSRQKSKIKEKLQDARAAMNFCSFAAALENLSLICSLLFAGKFIAFSRHV